MYMYMYIFTCICTFDILLIVCGCMCMHKHMRAQQTQMHVFFVMCFLTWGASADACSSRAQVPLPVQQRDQRTAAGRVRPAHIASVSARPRKRSPTPLSPPHAPLFTLHRFRLGLFGPNGVRRVRVYIRLHACMHACVYMSVYVCVFACMHVCVSVC